MSDSAAAVAGHAARSGGWCARLSAGGAALAPFAAGLAFFDAPFAAVSGLRFALRVARSVSVSVH